jgi:hypothetical protein
MSEPSLAAMPEPDAFATLGEDLLLLSIRARDGKLMTARRIAHGLMGSELIRLAATGRIGIAGEQIALREAAATGDTELDAALSSLTGVRRTLRPEAWVGLPRHGIRDAYLARLTADGVLRAEPSSIFGTPRYRITAPERLAAARSRIDAIARSPGEPLDVGQVALAGLASAIGLGSVLYPGRAGQPRRERLIQIAAAQTTRAARTASIGSPRGSSPGAAGPAQDVAADAAASAATRAAVSSATSAAVYAATSAAVNGAQSAGGRGPAPLGAGGYGIGGFGGHGDGHGGHPGGVSP